MTRPCLLRVAEHPEADPGAGQVLGQLLDWDHAVPFHPDTGSTDGFLDDVPVGAVTDHHRLYPLLLDHRGRLHDRPHPVKGDQLAVVQHEISLRRLVGARGEQLIVRPDRDHCTITPQGARDLPVERKLRLGVGDHDIGEAKRPSIGGSGKPSHHRCGAVEPAIRDHGVEER